MSTSTVPTERVLEALRQVVNNFKMPAIHMFAEGVKRKAAIHELNVFNEDTFVYEVYEPLIAKMGVTKAELRRRTKREWAAVPATAP